MYPKRLASVGLLFSIEFEKNNGTFPQPDAVIQHERTVTYGWLPETIEEYNTNKKEN